MTSKSIHLNKLIKFLQLDDAELKSALRNELRNERDKLRGEKTGSGDFHAPFWYDAKLHLIINADLKQATRLRVLGSKQRKRLYPMLAEGFLAWLDELRRSTNQTVGWLEGNVHNHFLLPDLQLEIKVDNLLALKIGADHHRLIYPYFSEKPLLTERWARVGLWIMSEALPNYSPVDMEILDVLRARSFKGARMFFDGKEESLLRYRYGNILKMWDDLRPVYGL